MRSPEGDLPFETEEKLKDAFLAGRVQGGWLVQFWADKSWRHVCDVPLIAAFYAQAPVSTVIEPRNVHVYVPGRQGYQAGPLTISEVKARVGRGEISPASWVFLEGDSEWRQVKAVEQLWESIPPLPHQGARGAGLAEGITGADADSIASSPTAAAEGISLGAAEPEVPAASGENQTSPSIKLDLQEAISLEAAGQPLTVSAELPPPKAPEVSFAPIPEAAASPVASAAMGEAVASKDGVDVESPTMAINTLGLSLGVSGKAPPKPPPPAAVKPVSAAAPAAPPAPALREESNFEGIVAEVSMDPIWLIKQGTSETATGPFRFLDVVKFLKEGKLSKNDKISRVGTNRFQKISQQYEFSVAYSVETVVRGGVETQRIVIRRRHPRVAYVANVQIIKGQQAIAGTCVNISAGGVLVEAPRLELTVGDKLILRVLPALIPRPIQCSVTVMGKVPKIPPGYSLQFDDLKKEDKEAIEFFVSETLKKEQAAKQNAAG
ncbi:MAG: PilZ domain-containing protein [Bdellovibrionales bacterium]|nr:PilZ domain-containing protein [Bdellovibrionales bacterium]